MNSGMALVLGLMMAMQMETGEISGEVETPAGAPICRLCPMELQDETGATRSLVAGVDGHFAFRGLNPGTYFIRLAPPGYKPFSEAVSVSATAVVRLRIALEPDTRTSEAVGAPATIHISSLLNTSSTSTKALINLSGSFLARSDFGSAARASLDALQKEPQNAAALLSLGTALYCSSMTELSRDALLKSLRFDSSSNPARLLLINLYLHERNWSEALGHIDAHLKAGTAERKTLLTARQLLRASNGMEREEFRLGFSITVGTSRLDIASIGQCLPIEEAGR